MDRPAQIRAIGVPWFARDDYDAFRQLMPERRWHKTFDDWQTSANMLLEQQERAGVTVYKAKVESNTFAQWCRETGRQIDSKALVEYASDFAYRQTAQK